MVLLLRVAMAYKKILLLDWRLPAPLTDFLVPNEIDWIANVSTGEGSSVRLSDEEFEAVIIDQNPDAIARFQAAKKLYFTTLKAPTVNQTAAFIPIEEHHDTSSDIGACYFNFLFKFNSTMGALADAHAAQLYGQWPVDYIAWQWRFLGSDGYYNSPIYMSELAATHACAERVAASMEIDIRQRPMVLITDSWLFRNLVQMDTFAELVVPDMTFPHAARGRGAAVQAMQEDFVKLYLVSRARCLLTSGAASGLPLWLRGAGGDGGRSSGNNSAPFAIAASTAGSAAGGPTTPLKRLLEDQQPLASCRYDMATCEPLL